MSQAQVQFQRADRLYHLAIKAFFVFAGVMLILIAFQVAHLQSDFSRGQSATIAQRDKDTQAARDRLQKALEETQHQQIVTQNYIRCIASVLLKPVSERSQEDFDRCGIPGVTDPSKIGQPDTNQGSTAPNQQSPAITPSSTPSATAPTTQSTQPKSNQPVAAGSPPDGVTSGGTGFLDKLPLVGGAFKAIGL